MTGQELLERTLILARKAERTGGPYPLVELRQAAEKEYPPAVYALATWYLHGREVKKNHKRAATLLRKAADAGFPPAEYDLAVCYELGSGVKKNLVKAFGYYLRAANNCDIDAQAEVARCFYLRDRNQEGPHCRRKLVSDCG